MRVLIACEFSGVVRSAFAALGHYAMSCDLMPSDLPGLHYQGNVLDIIKDGWDLMIAHPPCQYLSFAGNHVWNKPGRAELRQQAIDFALQLWNAPIDRIALENPLGCLSREIGKASQIIHPYYFGDAYKKRTCLWLKNLPKLEYASTILPEPEPLRHTTRKPVNWTEGITGKNRQKIRSKTFPGIANAFADQWGQLIA